MAGTLVIDTLKASSGVLATQNGMDGIAKAWVNFNGVSGASIRSSFNVSSVTRNGLGNYTVNMTTAMPNANYAIIGTANAGGDTSANRLVCVINVPTTSSFTFTTPYAPNEPIVYYDVYGAYIAVHA